MMYRAVFVAWLLVGLAPGPLFGGQASAPPRVRLKATAHLTIEGLSSDLDGARWHEGLLVESDADSVTLAMNTAGEPARLRVPRWSITDYQVYRGRSRGRAMLIGLGAGAGVGVIWGAIATSMCVSRNSRPDSSSPGSLSFNLSGMCGLNFVIPPMFTIPIGGAVGAAIGQARWETVPVDGLVRASPASDGR